MPPEAERNDPGTWEAMDRRGTLSAMMTIRSASEVTLVCDERLPVRLNVDGHYEPRQ